LKPLTRAGRESLSRTIARAKRDRMWPVALTIVGQALEDAWWHALDAQPREDRDESVRTRFIAERRAIAAAAVGGRRRKPFPDSTAVADAATVETKPP